MTKLGKKLFATFMIFVDKLDPFARKKVAYFLTTEEKELKKGLLARSCFQKIDFENRPWKRLGLIIDAEWQFHSSQYATIHHILLQIKRALLLGRAILTLSRWWLFQASIQHFSLPWLHLVHRVVRCCINNIGYLGKGGWAGGYFTNKSIIRCTGICFMIPRQSINFPESLPKAVVLKYCKLSYTEEMLVDSF